MDLPARGFKVTVTQSWDVYVYYQGGLVVDEDNPIDIQNEVVAMVCQDAINLIDNEDPGLVVKFHEDTESSNGFVAWVSDYDPDIDIEYTTAKMPAKLATELENLQKANKKND